MPPEASQPTETTAPLPKKGLRAASELLVVLSLVVVAADTLHFGFGLDIFVITHLMYLLLPLGMISYSWLRFGRNFALGSSVVLFTGGIAVELVGTRTGLPFGSYYYTSAFQPQILGVPIEIALGWLTLGLMCYSLASYRLGERRLVVPLAAMLMVAWDVLYDPVFVGLGMWVWRGGGYYTVPLSNFAGWFLASLLFFSVISVFRRRGAASHGRLIGLSPFCVYLSYLVDGTASNLALGQVDAALVGSSFMLLFALVAVDPGLLRRRSP
ncbi:MAG TPA: carotenoid biosynthesis protein [Conexivisphaerales archaeon]|nr:carotenoid biosynthesis protein [Conexivisphaerales archaeon]